MFDVTVVEKRHILKGLVCMTAVILRQTAAVAAMEPVAPVL
jgi:hypothetical protein